MNDPVPPLVARLAAEWLGTAGLLAVIVGSGIMAERLAGGSEALALLANSLATGAGLFALIVTFAPISGAHLNPAVTLSAWFAGAIGRRDAWAYALVQVVGAVAGTLIAHAIFAEPLLQIATRPRPGAALVASEALATLGLLLVIRAGARHGSQATPAAVACFITAAYWFTSSTSFANPAVTLARSLTDSFTGIRPVDTPGFLAGQGMAVGALLVVERLLWPARGPR